MEEINKNEKIILIGVPCPRKIDVQFLKSYMQLQGLEMCDVMFEQSGTIYAARDNIARYAIEHNYEYVLFLDSDMVLPSDLIYRLLEENTDMVTGLYFKRGDKFEPVIFKNLRTRKGAKQSNVDPITDYPKNTTFEIECAGMGCSLIKTKVFKEVYNKYHCMHELMSGIGEDFSFFLRARKLGYKLLCNTGIQCGHIADNIIITEDFFINANK